MLFLFFFLHCDSPTFGRSVVSQPAELKTPSSRLFVARDEQGYSIKLSSSGIKQLPDASCLYQTFFWFLFFLLGLYCLVRCWLLHKQMPGTKMSKENTASEHLTQTSGLLSVVQLLFGEVTTLTPKKPLKITLLLQVVFVFFFDLMVRLTRVNCEA